MNAEISGRHLRVFACVVQCIARLGKDVFWEASQSGVSWSTDACEKEPDTNILQIVIRTLNDSKSVFCAFYFEPGEPGLKFKTKRKRNPAAFCSFLCKLLASTGRGAREDQV